MVLSRDINTLTWFLENSEPAKCERPAAPSAISPRAEEETHVEQPSHENPAKVLQPSHDIESNGNSQEKPSSPSSSTQPAASYGPVRGRVGQKSSDAALYRPPAMLQEDFIEMMREVVPQLVDTPMNAEETRTGAPKERERDPDSPEEPPSSRVRTSSVSDEVLCDQDVNELLQVWDEGQSIETLVASYVQKKMSKELPPTGNSPELQLLVDEPKTTEWGKLIEKIVIKIYYGKKAAD